MIIYKITNKINGKVYVGQTVTTTKHQILCTTNGKVYLSLMEAARDLNLNSGNIQQVLKQKAKKTKGFHFVYLMGDDSVKR